MATHWQALLSPDRVGSIAGNGWARVRVDDATDLWGDARIDRHGRRVRLVVTASAGDEPERVANAVSLRCENLSLGLVARRGRVRPLVALPLVDLVRAASGRRVES